MSEENPINMSIRKTVQLPVTASEVAKFVARVPDSAEFQVVVVEGGSQRDPYPVRYILSAHWESEE